MENIFFFDAFDYFVERFFQIDTSDNLAAASVILDRQQMPDVISGEFD
jgi:hypothetical protein